MAHNLLYANYPERRLAGHEVQSRLERSWGIVPTSVWTWIKWNARYIVWRWAPPQMLLPFPLVLPFFWVPNKFPGIGIPTWQYDNAVRTILPEAHMQRYKGATPENLKRAIAEGKIVIVAFGWESNKEIIQKVRNKQLPKVGHYVVVIGYDKKNVYFLDPGIKPDVDAKGRERLSHYSWDKFLKHWGQGNFAIESNSMWVLSLEAKK